MYELPRRLPIFPLPDVVLFPNARLPLHMFEPRYRQLASDVTAAQGCFGMVLLRPPARTCDGSSPVFDVGCAGPVSNARAHADGRFDLVLEGRTRFRIVGELPSDRLYRFVEVEPLDETQLDELAAAEREALREIRSELEQIVVRTLSRATKAEASEIETQLARLDDAELVHAIAFQGDLSPVERQSLLECDDLVARARSLLSLLRIGEAGSTAPDHARTLN